jgi:uncharacterized Zn finger protein (UPF0148 family)
MSIFDKLKNLTNRRDNKSPSEHQETQKDNIDSRNSFCPTCGVLLKEKPTKKIKCPDCHNNIYVITNPETKEKILATEQQKIWNDAQIKIERESKAKEKLEQDPEFVKMRERLRDKYGAEPSIYDISWSLANQHLIEYSKENNWAGYRNTKLEMAQLLRKEKRLELSLRTYLELCYLDLNGPMNPIDPELRKQFPPFDVNMARLAPGIISEIKIILKKTGSDIEQAKVLFFEIASVNYRALKLPVSPLEAWTKIETAITN